MYLDSEMHAIKSCAVRQGLCLCEISISIYRMIRKTVCKEFTRPYTAQYIIYI